MKKYVMAVFTAAVIAGCSKDSVTTDPIATKDGTSSALAQNCNKGSISGGQYNMISNVFNDDGGSQCITYNNNNSWGVNASHNGSGGIKAYPAVVYGCHYGYCSTNTGLPKQVSQLGNVHTNWTQSSSGNAYDAAYDIWFDPSAYPGNRANKYELMIWLRWSNTKPIAQNYDASGNAIPYASNVSLSGKTWNVYHRDNTTSFLPTTQTNSVNIDVKPFINYMVSKGFMGSSNYMTSVQAGWEIIQGGTFSTSSYSVSGI